MRSVDARISDHRIHADRHWGHTPFQRSQRRLIAGSLRGHLIHRDTVADIGAGRLLDGRASQDRGLLDVMPVASLGSRIPEVAHYDDPILEALERLERRRELE